jgi:hypothetical protein
MHSQLSSRGPEGIKDVTHHVVIQAKKSSEESVHEPWYALSAGVELG